MKRIIRKILMAVGAALLLAFPALRSDAQELNQAATGGDDYISESLGSLLDLIEKGVAGEQTRPLNVEIVLSDIYSNKDLEFSRGFILGLNRLSLPESAISLKLVNGEIPEDSLYFETELFAPDVIVLTQEKNFPAPIADYISGNSTDVINVFDVRGNEYVSNDKIIQLLTPSAIFNNEISDFISTNLSDCKVIIVGEPDTSDFMITTVNRKFPSENVINIKPEEIAELQLTEGDKYLIYVASGHKPEIKGILNALQQLRYDYPAVEINILGRSNWIAMADIMELFQNAEVFIPSKCYFNPQTIDGKFFINTYNEAYGHAPIRSFPMYAAMGYDVANYFIPKLIDAMVSGDAPEWSSTEGLQSNIVLRKASDRGGRYNAGVYLLKFLSDGSVEKFPIN